MTYENKEFDITPTSVGFKLLDSLVCDYTSVYHRTEFRRSNNGTLYNFVQWPGMRHSEDTLKKLFIVPRLRDCFFVINIRNGTSYGLEVYYSRYYKTTEDIFEVPAVNTQTPIDPDNWTTCLRAFGYGTY